MNLLVITHFYEEDGVIGSIRWTNFIHRLARKHHVYVLTHKPTLRFRELQVEDRGNVTLLFINNENIYLKFSKKRRKKSKIVEPNNTAEIPSYGVYGYIKKWYRKIKSLIKIRIAIIAIRVKSRENCRIVSRYLDSHNIRLNYVLSTSRPLVNALTARNLVTTYHLPWLMDQRDLPFSDGASADLISVFRGEFQKFDRYVSIYTIVSYGMRDVMIQSFRYTSEQAAKIHVLHNGFNRDDCPTNTDVPVSSGKLVFSYAGDLYSGKRDVSMLFQAIRNLIDRGAVVSSNFVVDYAGNSCDSLLKEADIYGLRKIVIDNGKLPRKEVLRKQASADILLLLTLNTSTERGVLTGKIYEYMLIGKPILCITCGDIPGGEATQTIRDLRLGLAVEESANIQDIPLLEAYILQQLKRKKKGLPLIFEPDNDGISQFDHDKLAVKLMDLMSKSSSI